MSSAVDVKMRVRPLFNKVVIKQDNPAEASDGGIVLPDAAQTQQQFGTVMAAGPGRQWPAQISTDPMTMSDPWLGPRFPMSLQVGDRVLLGAYTPEPFRFDGEDFLIMNEDDVLAVIDEGD